MSNMWWLQPGWTDATCIVCGCNIYASGGDPDMGYCPDCYEAEFSRQRHEEEMRQMEERQMEEHFRRNPHG